jgi:3-methylcrotonyl-CoA carboxylase alpha subunit
VDGLPKEASVTWCPDGPRVTVEGASSADAARPHRVIELADGAVVIAGGRQRHVALKPHDTMDPGHAGGDGTVPAPMNGRIVAVFVEPGQHVAKGTRLAVMEAMKMEHSLTAPIDGTVSELTAVPGAQVIAGATIVRIEADAEKP